MSRWGASASAASGLWSGCRSGSPSAVAVGGLHVVGWGVLVGGVLPFGIQLSAAGGGPLTTIGIGLSAYLLGMRHAFDPDHIAAIDNTTRRFVATDRPARSVGLWFSLGHSTVVLALCVLLLLFGNSIAAAISDGRSSMQLWTGIIGPVVSGVFLLLVAVVNLTGLRRHPHPRGPVTWLLRRFDRVIDRPSRMYLAGLLFGAGFDTATEVALLVLAGTASVGSVPWWAVLALPVLFAAGMTLLDSLQGSVARRAYSWAPGHARAQGHAPAEGHATAQGHATVARRHAVVMTSMSVAVALVVGVVQLMQVASVTLGIDGPLAWAGSLEVSWLGLGLTAAIVAVWAIVSALTRPGVAIGGD